MRMDEILTVHQFVDVKGWKAIGNKIEDVPLISVVDQSKELSKKASKSGGFKAGDTIEFDI